MSGSSERRNEYRFQVSKAKVVGDDVGFARVAIGSFFRRFGNELVICKLFCDVYQS